MKKILFVLIMLFTSQAFAGDLYAVFKGNDGTALELYASKNGCPGQSRYAVYTSKYGIKTAGCWLDGAEEIMVKYYDEWQNPYLYKRAKFVIQPGYRG